MWISQLGQLSVTCNETRSARRDPTPSLVLEKVKKEWSDEDKEYQSYFKKRHELSTSQRVLTWRMKIIIPLTIRKRLLKILHKGHLGIVKMKAQTRSCMLALDRPRYRTNNQIMCRVQKKKEKRIKYASVYLFTSLGMAKFIVATLLHRFCWAISRLLIFLSRQTPIQNGLRYLL